MWNRNLEYDLTVPIYNLIYKVIFSLFSLIFFHFIFTSNVNYRFININTQT